MRVMFRFLMGTNSVWIRLPPAHIPQTPSESLRIPPTIGDDGSPQYGSDSLQLTSLRFPQTPSESLPLLATTRAPSVDQTPSSSHPSDSIRIPQNPSHDWRRREPPGVDQTP